MKAIKIGLDVDDVLFSCNQYAIDLYNQTEGTSFRLSEIKGWNNNGDIDARTRYFEDPEFFETQPLMPGAKEFVAKLQTFGEVFFITAISSKFVESRAARLKELFPDVPEKNYVFTTRKDLVNVDTLFDDGPHNIMSSIAKFPVLFRKPWNHGLSGMLAVNSYDEYICLVERIAASYSTLCAPKIYCLVGPSGAGKTAILQEVCKSPLYERPRTYTTRERREEESENAYCFVSQEEFEKTELLETTVYAGNYYGTAKPEIDRILEKGKKAIFALDICGANAIRTHYGRDACLVFVKRNRKAILQSIMDRSVSAEDKVNRILSLDDEDKNELLCDYIITNNGSLQDAVSAIERI